MVRCDWSSDVCSSDLTAFASRVFPTHNELICEPGCVGKMKTPTTTCNSRLAGGFSRLAGILPEKHEKTAPAPRLPGVITLTSKLRFTQNLYCWKVEVKSFPEICCMIHFEHQQASKSALENRIRKGYMRENRRGFGGGVAWRIRSPHGTCTNSRATITSRVG